MKSRCALVHYNMIEFVTYTHDLSFTKSKGTKIKYKHFLIEYSTYWQAWFSYC